MLKSLHTKLVLILVALVIAVMTIVGTFLINSVTEYNISKFKGEMADVFTSDFILSLQERGKTENGYDGIRKYLDAYAGSLGIGKYRIFYILDSKSGEYLAGSDDTLGKSMEATANILTAMNGQVGERIQSVGGYFDVAIPVDCGEKTYIVGVMDTKNDLNTFTWSLISALLRAMIFGLVIVILLSYILSKTITNPVERLTSGAIKLSKGSFGEEISVESQDEIGVLTHTFNEMAVTLKSTIDAVEGERNKLNTMFSHMNDGVVAFDGEGMLIHVNPAAKKMLGMELGEGMHYKNVFKNLHIEGEDLNMAGGYIEIDYAAQGNVLKLFIASFNSGDESGIIGVLHDVTEQARLDESRREFVANVSHELRTPLTNIKGYTETLISAEDIDAETRTSFLNVVHSEADRMTGIVKDLLTLSKLDHGKVDIKEERLELGMVIASGVAAMSMEAKRQQVELVHNVASDLAIIGDAERFTQVIINLLSNAIKYNKKDGTVTIQAKEVGATVEISIKDTGIGIPEQDIPRIFERFYRVDKARSRERGGTGLGLAIAKEIIEQHGGHVHIQSQYGDGTTVTIVLPKAV